MKPFQQRNPIPIAIIGVVLIALGLVAAMNSDELPLIGSGTVYTAEFEEAAGLKDGDEVRVAGIKVGKVKDVELDGNVVLVSFYVKDTWMGDTTRAGIKLKDLLGQKFLAVEPSGGEVLDPSETIPNARTTSPFDVLEAFRGLSETTDAIDVNQLAKSFDVISKTFGGTSDEIKGALNGLSQLSDTIAKRDTQLSNLLENTRQISQTLADRDAQLVKLMKDGNVLLAELSKRKAAISSLLQGIQQLAVQLNGLVDDNKAQLQPVLKDLDRLTGMLHRNREALGEGIETFAPFVRQFNNTLGNGRWFDNYICGLLLPQEGPINQQGCDPR
ncbi:MCE family protein [Haloechinothrix halophila]|uniref:Virulence factor Mce family protein n=1 Tax=Haloechinothrix halophila YIM 93223 TaxID=592678 RepID=W9DRX2_9PSEU|nr:MCE family protein [Haloechinothrix halophila]ETA66437.1 virulence factor Mce family protein [Haloechinothrix halophila YIM 93223]